MNSKKDSKAPKTAEKKPSATTAASKIETNKKPAEKTEPVKKGNPPASSGIIKSAQSKLSETSTNSPKVESVKPASKSVISPSTKPATSSYQKTTVVAATKPVGLAKGNSSGSLTPRDNKAKSGVTANQKGKIGQ